MDSEANGSILVNPREVVGALQDAPFRYPALKQTEQYRGWSSFPVIPGLFQLMAKQSLFPDAVTGYSFLMDNCDRRYAHLETFKRRAQKLYMDFCREMHTLGLLQQCDDFGWVQYQKAFDIGYDVDFVIRLVSSVAGAGERFGVQAMMRNCWPAVDEWNACKAARRLRRGCQVWDGPVVILSNKPAPGHNLAIQSVKGCWLFTHEHVNLLTEQITAGEWFRKTLAETDSGPIIGE